MRGTFGNIRLHNRLVEPKEGPYTVHLPDRARATFIYDAAMRYIAEGVPLIVIAGREYGSGSSRDWAAKGPSLLGVRAVLAESFERIHRSNLVGMGILPLQFKPGDGAASLGLTGRETFSILGLEGGASPRQTVTVVAARTTPATAAVANVGSRRSPASTARSTSTTTAAAASCRRSSGAWRPNRPDRSDRPAGNAKPPGEDRRLRLRGEEGRVHQF